MRAIFIEGVSGAGKTTAARNLCCILRGIGCQVKLYLEGDFDNPVDFYSAAYLSARDYAELLARYASCTPDIERATVTAGDVRLVRYCNGKKLLFPEPLLSELRRREFCYNPASPVPAGEYTRVYGLLWENFAIEHSDAPGFVIFDGSLLHHPANDMMHNYGADTEAISRHVNVLLSAAVPLDPLVVYLRPSNLAELYSQVRAARGKAPPTGGQIHYWEKRLDIDLAVLSGLPVPYVTYNVSHTDRGNIADEVADKVTTE